MLFRNKDAMLEECRVSGTSWYKRNDKNIDEDDMGENKKVKRVPAKVALYFPIIHHLRWVIVVARERAQKRYNVLSSCWWNLMKELWSKA
jgi:hypothetical protein